ncbi:hypothetical protein [Amycolatopsis jiangsuensis]|uniref:Uncharacterized protein n=1 Tax=Amycolatopsis jiangsuensis TaxID=1181879 RepID=A0A840IVE0_9PSEU|nr:hypothetical protein [Amycolatopsis jiangsuensis]MBB4686506.1 hypothetical protein [Amycolatopsis jiangsuensis]
MAEQRDDGQPFDNHPTDTPAGGPPNLPQPANPAQPPTPQAQAPVPQPSGSRDLDPEQYRQFQEFQEFQRFQEYLRFTQAQQGTQPAPLAEGGGLVPAGARQPQTQAGGQPPAPPDASGALTQYEPPRRPRRPVPRWLKRLGGKILGWVLVVVLLGIAATWAYHHFFPSDDGKSSAQIAAEGGGTYHTNQILTTASPYESVRRVYDGVAQHGPGQRSMVDHVCGLFDEATQQKFATDLRYPSCAAAVEGLHAALDPAPGSVDAYAESISKRSGWPPGDSVVVSSCEFAITGGPALGDFTVKQVEKSQWLIVGHQPGPRTCPAPPTR